jgi:hypothetical protein
MFGAPQRLWREQRTIAAMIALYCRGHHRERVGRRGLCAECAALDAYAAQRLDRCVFGPEKPTCFNCPIHCYKRDMREAIREVMRWAGPRMLRRHPVLAILHVLDGRRLPPAQTPRRGGRLRSAASAGP